jgi:Polysaccharide biosynthesis/export protein/SLBB domain
MTATHGSLKFSSGMSVFNPTSNGVVVLRSRLDCYIDPFTRCGNGAFFILPGNRASPAEKSGYPGYPLTLVLVGALVFGACARRDISPPPLDPIPMARETYVIGVEDELKITVWKNGEISLARVPVRWDGMISIPLLDDLQAEGLQPMELKEVITRELSEFITAPDVTVTVLESKSRSISIMGEVKRNARFPIKRDMRVLEAVAQAGGFTNFADKSDIRIVRQQPDLRRSPE